MIQPLERFKDNPEALEAHRLLEQTTTSVFLTGKAGTGKSTFLRDFLHTSQKKCAVVAPTGIAAINVEGQTIHSFFLLEPRAYRPIEPTELFPSYRNRRAKLITELEVLIIDEISMVRADLLTAIDLCLKKHMGNSLPFGGKQMLFIGDLFQLPPVVNSKNYDETAIVQQYPGKYFFDAAIDELEFKTIELITIYRQSSEERVFIEMLNRIREGNINDRLLQYINNRVMEMDELPDKVITISTVNREVDYINQAELNRLEGELHHFTGEKRGSFERKRENDLPSPERLELKAGARVMFTKNDLDKKWVNGTLGTVASFEDRGIWVELDNGVKHLVSSVTWEDNKYEWNDKERSIDKTVVGEYVQYPLKLAWAITIHKSQGLTFDRVYIDLHSGAFDTGQVYVALSRCTTFEGIWLASPVLESDIMVDPRISQFYRQLLRP